MLYANIASNLVALLTLVVSWRGTGIGARS